MNQYYFLFLIAFVYTIVASVEDIRKTEVPNWLNFSFVSLAIAYRAIYAVFFNDVNFFVFGVLGCVLFFLIADMFYYTKTFGGGDAKLLIGFGAILPFANLWDLLFLGGGFILLLFFVGAIYTLIYSLFLVMGNREKFAKSFSLKFRQRKRLLIFSIFLVVILFIETWLLQGDFRWFYIVAAFFIFVPALYIYLKALEESCMIGLTAPRKLCVGDWLEKEVRIGNRTIGKSVHGLSREDIDAIKKSGRRVWIRSGVPFVPAFLIALIIMVFFFSILRFDFRSFFGFLF